MKKYEKLYLIGIAKEQYERTHSTGTSLNNRAGVLLGFLVTVLALLLPVLSGDSLKSPILAAAVVLDTLAIFCFIGVLFTRTYLDPPNVHKLNQEYDAIKNKFYDIVLSTFIKAISLADRVNKGKATLFKVGLYFFLAEVFLLAVYALKPRNIVELLLYFIF
ncbi:MAG: hypothetical protein ACE5DX_03745 [Candidatus Dojkabacteria bacterium]